MSPFWHDVQHRGSGRERAARPGLLARLAKPEYKGEVGDGFKPAILWHGLHGRLATLVQLFGEDEPSNFWPTSGANVNQHTKSGSPPARWPREGRTTIAVGFMHDMVNLKKQGFPVEIVSPCEGTGYEVGAVSVIAGTPNIEAAKKWVDYVISAEAQSRGLEVGVFNIPLEPRRGHRPRGPGHGGGQVIDYDFATYGSSETRERLLARWEADVKSKAAASRSDFANRPCHRVRAVSNFRD